VTTASAPLRHESPGAYLGLLLAVGLFGLAIALGFAVAVGEVAAFYVALAVVAGIAVLFDYRIGAVLLIVLLPMGATNFMPHSVFNIPSLNPFNILLIATLFSFILHERMASIAPKQLVWLYIAPILIAGVIGMQHAHKIPIVLADTLIFSDAFGYFREMAVRPLLMVLAVLLVGAAAARSQKPERFLIPLMFTVWLLALLQIGFILASGVRIGFLATSASRAFYSDMGLHANDLGRIFAVAYGLMLFVWWETKQPQLKTALFLTLGIASLAMVLSFSRGAFLGFFAINALFLLWKFNARTMGLALLAAAFVTLAAPEYLWDRITMGFETGDPNRVSADRIDGIWLPLLPELWKTPLWGNGLGSTMFSLPMLTGGMLVVAHPHSAYLEVLLDMGVIGLCLMLAYFWHVWRGFRALGSNAYLTPEMRAFFQGATAALVCFFISGWFGSSFRPLPEFGFLWLAIGMMYGMQRRTRSANN
jgi:hypothetical protein